MVMKNQRWIFSALAVVFGAVPLCSGAATPAQAQALRPPAIQWSSCGLQFSPAECAVVRVPLDYDQPTGPTIELALARIAAANQGRKIGTVFVNPGGPGASAIDTVIYDIGEDLANRLDGRFDIVGFDPRGVGASSPVFCTDESTEIRPLLFPFEPSQFQPFFEKHRRLGHDCYVSSLPTTAHMSTADTARDMDLLRAAVGDARLTYLGFSYGTQLGNTYAHMFPDRVRAVALDGVLDPRLWTSGLQFTANRVSVPQEFEEFLRLCDEAKCRLSEPGGAKARWNALVASLRKKPLQVTPELEYRYDHLIFDATQAMYVPEYWPLYGEFFATIIDFQNGVFPQAQRLVSLRAELQRLLRSAAPTREPQAQAASNGFAFFDAFNGVVCSDAEFPQSLALFTTFGAYAEAGSIFGPTWWWQNAECADHPVAQDRYAGPWGTRTSAPILLVGNYFDGITNYDGAVASNQLLTNSRLLSYAGWGHTAYLRSECATEYMVAWVAASRRYCLSSQPESFLLG
jgi:pimeloyl-ACP methyl ester carboxylesterase